MNDKTAIEKAARKVLADWESKSFGEQEKLIKSEYGTYWSPAGRMISSDTIHELREALAALDAEKPADGAEQVVDEIGRSLIHNVSYGCGGRDCIDSSEAVPLIQHFAASYHAEQCKACNDFCARAKEHCEDREAPLV